MLHVGDKLASEEVGPRDLVRLAVRAEAAGFDVALILAAIRRASRAGYDHVCEHQIGPHQEGFVRFSETQVFPRLARFRARRAPPGQRRAA